MREPQHPSRRDFLARSSAAIAATSFVAANAHAGGSDALRIGLVGCGGRGTGAAEQALTADKGNKLVAVGDAFADAIKASLSNLSSSSIADQVAVPEDRRYAGFDAFQKVIDQVDVVLLCTPPAFRPQHLAYAVNKGIHAFVEKPVATDGAGVRSVLESCKVAREKNLSLASGHCWRYEPGRRETMQQVFDGKIGDIVAIETTYNSQGVWEPRKTREQCGSEMEYQMRNWYYYLWLSGDHIVEQAVHGLDTMGWVMDDKAPLRCWGTGGRQVRTDPKYGNIFDHFAIVYEYPNNVRGYHTCRHWVNSANQVKDYVLGSKGTCDVFGNTITGRGENDTLFRYRGPKKNMYQVEHDELFAAIRKGDHLRNVDRAAASTMLALMGRTAAYTGKVVTYDEVLNSTERLVPEAFDWDDNVPKTPIPVPGVPRLA
ncbi:MAG: Gfo/Idh/MocA family oxidoreductase [Isosphaeraceae bacterium]